MTYTPTGWQDAPSANTPITAASLNNIESGVANAHGALDGRLSDAQLNARFSGAATLDPAKRYRTVACAIRNEGSGFQVISDAGHVPVGVSSVTESNGNIVIGYDFTAKRVISLVATPDEAMATRGIHVGASVGLTAATIMAAKSSLWSDYISYDAASSALKSVNGLAYRIDLHPTQGVNGWLRFAFNSPVDMTVGGLGGVLTSRNPAMAVVFEGMGPVAGFEGEQYGGFNFRFVDSVTGAPITAPNLADVKVWATMNSNFTRKLAPSELTAPSSNFWIYGVFEV